METNERRGVTPGTNDAIIWAEGVIKTYDTGTTKVQALKEIDFVVRARRDDRRDGAFRLR